ncbi:MAG TPA: putative toxin-antitoxin system toxin component, PIN family [Acidobacteriaceae bacterium]|nr:putative toxin-antitoxin system toxin component, PIN family [Acidobacteriaceae bacterium]
MNRLVLDTNVRISSLLSEYGTCRKLTNAARQSPFVQVVSHALMAELRETLIDKFRWPEDRVGRAIEDSFYGVEIVTPELRLNVCRDPDDNRVLECALAGHADLIITGDQDLLTLDPFKNIRIISVRDFMNRLVDQAPDNRPNPLP